MRKNTKLCIALLNLALLHLNVLAGQNERAVFQIDLNYYEQGNQNVTEIDAPGIDHDIYIDLYMLNASNLDAYQFTFSFNPQHLLFCSFEKNKTVDALGKSFAENNILLKNDPQGTLLSVSKNDSTSGSFAVTLAYPQTDDIAADGNGFLGTLCFKTLVVAPENVVFRKVKFVDNNSVKDVCPTSQFDSVAVLGGQDLLSDVKGDGAKNLEAFILQKNFPNPFNMYTNISFKLPETKHVQLVIYNSLGQKIRTLGDQEYASGYYCVRWDSRDSQNKEVPAGMYIVRLLTNNLTETKNILLVK
ncbi:T9SS C-terminal target domain-containing protein [candidate division KSB1 bacterium]|nr:T9SS type A sorting domain-containing protein [candidate division KSB1 bacterium]RQW00916.1 MAG: T9SS C-terminal target domain-containing protein [candidate division KSB1 bacterium]